jgi:hypothetical protein
MGEKTVKFYPSSPSFYIEHGDIVAAFARKVWGRANE